MEPIFKVYFLQDDGQKHKYYDLGIFASLEAAKEMAVAFADVEYPKYNTHEWIKGNNCWMLKITTDSTNWGRDDLFIYVKRQEVQNWPKALKPGEIIPISW